MKKKAVKLLFMGALIASMSTMVVACDKSGQTTGGDAEVKSVADIDYANVYFDYKDQITEQKKAVKVVPDAAAISLSATDEKNATAVMVIAASDATDSENYYLGAMVAGNKIKFEGGIAQAESSVNGALEVKDGVVEYAPATLNAKALADEVITFTMTDGAVYKLHTLPETFPQLQVTGDGVADADKGVYSFALDKYLLRVNTEGDIVYYRNVNSAGENMVENMAPQDVDGKQYYSVFVELNREFRNAQGGFSSGYYLVMDENYVDKDGLTLFENDDANHTHGEGYLDQHEFVILGDNHYLLLSYTQMLVDNLPESVKGIDGGNTAYVWAGIIQEVKDGKVIGEICTADYPLLYESAVEKIDYANSTLDGVTVVVGQNEVQSYADGIMDYVHVNSIDYTMEDDGSADKILVSMRDQSAVYQFDMDTGAMEWILGGKASTLGGYDEYTTVRTDDNGTEFNALTFGQHFARYTNKTDDGTIMGNPIISVFDNQTGTAPFIMAAEVPTKTRVFKAEIDAKAGTATLSDVIVGADLNALTGKYHNASHCGSVQYDSDTSVTIGWGLHGVIDNIGAFAPEGTIGDIGFEDLRIGSIPVFTDYNAKDGKITFELSGTRNAKMQSHEGFFSYRTYKTAY